MTEPPPPLELTRRSLHAVAEHVLAAALHAATGHIGLRATPGGFGTPSFGRPDGTRQVRVDGTELVVTDDGVDRRAPLTTVRAAAELAGIDAGAPASVYTPVTPLEPDRALDVDHDDALALAAFFANVAGALAELGRHQGGTTDPPGATDASDPLEAQLWPEHFDLALTLDEVNYGGSPGDDDHPLPYLYVGPWRLPTDGDPFWNEPFGASITIGSELDVAAALAFFTDGQGRLAR